MDRTEDEAMAEPTCPFEIHHGTTVVRIADDWSGHVLIEQIYDGLRRARRSRDAGHAAAIPPAPGSEAADALIEAATAHGFRPVDGGASYRASPDQIVALMTWARKQGRKETITEAQPEAPQG